MNRALLIRKFSRCVKTYECWAIPQKESLKELLNFAKVEGRVLDVGCGTGLLRKTLGEGVVSLDISFEMLKSFEGLKVLGDAHSLPFKDKSFDWCVSNFVLHWTNLEVTLGEILRVCKNYAIALPLEGSLKEFNFPFPSLEEVLKVLKGSTYKVKKIEIPFKGWELLKFFHYTGTTYSEDGKVIASRKKLKEILNKVEEPYFLVGFFKTPR